VQGYHMYFLCKKFKNFPFLIIFMSHFKVSTCKIYMPIFEAWLCPRRWSLLDVTSKIPWQQELIECCLGSFYEEKYFFQIFLLDKWTTYFRSFPWIPSTSNFVSVWACGEILLKVGKKLIFNVFLRSSYM
jgi:hypothetical protein